MQNSNLFLFCAVAFITGFMVAYLMPKKVKIKTPSKVEVFAKKPPLYKVSKKYGNIYASDVRWNEIVCEWHYDIIYTAPNGNVGAGDVFESRLTELINQQK